MPPVLGAEKTRSTLRRTQMLCDGIGLRGHRDCADTRAANPTLGLTTEASCLRIAGYAKRRDTAVGAELWDRKDAVVPTI
jgi:hypothetical protein